MTTEPRTFTPRPLRGVKSVYVRQGGCPSVFAPAVADFEPWEPGVEYEVAGTSTAPSRPPKWATELHDAFGSGVREALAALGPETAVAVAVVLRSVTVHEVDSHPWRSSRPGGSPHATRRRRRTVHRRGPGGNRAEAPG
ncbi:hypothetical protein [Streptomyces sp. V2I9]|uniref:hypothetical protein n=1 Tax=Streptomyces sp. V2I9 TaxID=3042304 RepID=UPI002780AC28|nr:hypothetical protein [Streptomyces sp. V2I9]MDQ0988442.1 hypothetical protein [Streptomyces sp. V2I9]